MDWWLFVLCAVTGWNAANAIRARRRADLALEFATLVAALPADELEAFRKRYLSEVMAPAGPHRARRKPDQGSAAGGVSAYWTADPMPVGFCQPRGGMSEEDLERFRKRWEAAWHSRSGYLVQPPARPDVAPEAPPAPGGRDR